MKKKEKLLSDDEEQVQEEDQEERLPKKKKAKQPAEAPKAKKKAKPAKEPSEDDNDNQEDEVPESNPKSKKRTVVVEDDEEEEQPKPEKPARKVKRKQVSDEDEQEEVQVKVKKVVAKKPTKQSEDEAEEEVAPVRGKSRVVKDEGGGLVGDVTSMLTGMVVDRMKDKIEEKVGLPAGILTTPTSIIPTPRIVNDTPYDKLVPPPPVKKFEQSNPVTPVKPTAAGGIGMELQPIQPPSGNRSLPQTSKDELLKPTREPSEHDDHNNPEESTQDKYQKQMMEKMKILKQFNIMQPTHPGVCFFHLFFKVFGVFSYMFLGLMVNSSLINFLLNFVCIVLDFWITKNVSGRYLAGLRWWNDDFDEESGEQIWEFESYDFDLVFSQVDTNVFWWGMFAMTAFWGIMFIIKCLGLNFLWGLLTFIGALLSGMNLWAYFKCARNHKEKLDNLYHTMTGGGGNSRGFFGWF